jgi:chromosome segregation ATPase
MSTFYRFVKEKMQGTLQAGKTPLRAVPEKKAAGNLTMIQEIERLERLVIDRASKLKQAASSREATLTEQAHKLEQLTGAMKSEIAGLRGKLKEAQESIAAKDLARQKSEETLVAQIQNLEHEVSKRDEIIAARDTETKNYRAKIDQHLKQIDNLEQLTRKSEEDAAAQAKRADETARQLEEKITDLEARIKEADDLARERDSENGQLAANLQELDRVVKRQQELLKRRDGEINDLKSQLGHLTAGLSHMQSFFKHAGALQGRDVLRIADGEAEASFDEPEPAFEDEATYRDEPAAVHTTMPTPAAHDREDSTPRQIIDQIVAELSEATNMMEPLASLIVQRQAKALGASLEHFPRARIPELLEVLAQDIPDEDRQIDFRRRIADNAHIPLE